MSEHVHAVYRELLRRHLVEARKDINSPRRAAIFNLIEGFRSEFPEECDAWDRFYGGSAQGGSR